MVFISVQHSFRHRIRPMVCRLDTLNRLNFL